MFADHSALFIEDGMVKQSLFRQADKTGVHINEKGVQVLNENLIKAPCWNSFQEEIGCRIWCDTNPLTSIMTSTSLNIISYNVRGLKNEKKESHL